MNKPIYKDSSYPIEARIKDLLSRMTLEEKAKQLDYYSVHDVVHHENDTPYFNQEAAKNVFANVSLGGFGTPYGPKINNAIQRYAIEHTRLGIPVLLTAEGLHGVNTPGCTIFPQQIGLASTWEPRLAYETGAAIAAEAKSLGVCEVWAPVLDLGREPRWGRTEEGYGEDTYLAKSYAAAFVKGMQGEDVAAPDKVMSEPKHFSAYGVPIGGLNCAPAAIGMREHYAAYLPVFEAAFVEGGAFNTMCSYSSVDGIPCSADYHLLTEILREKWGMRGYVRSDMCAVSMLRCDHDVADGEAEAIRMGLEAGVDMQLYDFPHDVYQNTIVNLVKEGRLSEAVVDRAVSRVLNAKFIAGLFDTPYVDEHRHLEVIQCKKHQDLALEAARKSICLLKNQDHLLPLKKDLKKIAVIGPSAAVPRLGDYCRKPEGFEAVTLLDGIKNLVSEQTQVQYAKGCEILGELEEDALEEAVTLAKEAEVVILAVGDSTKTSGENFDRADLNLPGSQLELVKAIYRTKTPIVLVIMSGRPVSALWEDAHIPAIIEAWFPGEKGGTAIAEVLFGEWNPSGRLPVSFPKSVGQLPVHYSRKPAGNKRYVEMDRKPLYPFGYGLSYTTFAYSCLRLSQKQMDIRKINAGDKLKVSFDVTNTGERAGDEVTQLYIRDVVASVVHPYIELKGFEKVHLEAGETKTIVLEIGFEELKVLGVDFRWKVEVGKFLIFVGSNAEELVLQEEFFVIKDK